MLHGFLLNYKLVLCIRSSRNAFNQIWDKVLFFVKATQQVSYFDCQLKQKQKSDGPEFQKCKK